MKVPSNIDEPCDHVFSEAVGIVGLRGALITQTRPRVVARVPFNTLFNSGRVTGSVRRLVLFSTYRPRKRP